ncbi:hypothetical protein [Streptomyces sp. NPDC059076]|uniref:hypothetical protein n=1 Tax=unclassified Streptomyces TaxID=2593676 RepID=UPI0036C8D13F
MSRDRVLTQHALTGEWQSLALPLTDIQYGPELNGPGSLTGRLSPRLLTLSPTLVDPGTTCIYVESEGRLRWGGLVWHIELEGDALTLEAASWTSYLQRRFDLDGNFGGRGPYVYADRCKVARDIWAYAQSIPDGNLGVTVDSTTSTSTIGTPADKLTSAWWDSRSLGDHLDDLVSPEATPDYTCTTSWNSDKTDVVKRIRLGWPRLGARRTDLTFSTGVNIVEDPAITLSGDEYAQVVIALGAGDGSAKRREISAIRNGRLRLEHVSEYPEAKGRDILAGNAAAERKRRQNLRSVDRIIVRDSPAAPIGSWQIGDDVYTRVHNAWTDYVGWRRITSWTIEPAAQGGPRAVIDLEPADSYQYGGV